MDPVLTDCYVWLFDQLEYTWLVLHTWYQLRGEVSRARVVTVIKYVDTYGRDPPRSLTLLPDEPMSPAQQSQLQAQLHNNNSNNSHNGITHAVSQPSSLREGSGSRGSGLMDLMLLRRVSSLASSTSSLFQEGLTLSTPLSGHASYRGALTETLRTALVSILCDLSQVPFANVSVSAMVGEGRLPELYPFQGYYKAFTAIMRQEGAQGLFRGWLWVCVAGLYEDYPLLHAQLQGDEDEHEEEEDEDDSSLLTPHQANPRRGEEEGRSGGRRPQRMRDYQLLLETATAALQAELSLLSASVTWVYHTLTFKHYHTTANPQESSLRPSPYSSTSLVSHHQAHTRAKHSWLMQGWRNPATVVQRACRALVLHPLPLLAVHAITGHNTPHSIRLLCGGWGGLWSGAYTSIVMALYREPLLCVFSAPFVIRSRRMLLLNKTGAASAALSAAAVPLIGRQTLGLIHHILKQDGLPGLWSGSRALLWGVLPSMLCCMLTRLALKLLGIADSPRKTRRDRRRVEYVKHLMRQCDWRALSYNRFPPSNASQEDNNTLLDDQHHQHSSGQWQSHSHQSPGEPALEPLGGHYRPFQGSTATAATALIHVTTTAGPNGHVTATGGGNRRTPPQPPMYASNSSFSNQGLGSTLNSSGSLSSQQGLASGPSPYVLTPLTAGSGMRDGGYDADTSNSTGSSGLGFRAAAPHMPAAANAPRN